MKNKTAKIYSKKDYADANGMLTTIWGPGVWHFLHTISFNYPTHPTKIVKHQYMDFVQQLQYVLPCGKCRENLKTNFKHLPLTMKHMTDRRSFSTYIYKLHELVNKMLNKKSGLSYDVVRERYEHFRARCTQTEAEKVAVVKEDEDKHMSGCIYPLTGEKTKCVLHFVPQSKKTETFVIDKKCLKKRFTSKKIKGRLRVI